MTYTYDAVGNLVEMKDELKRFTSQTFDGLNRRISVTLPDPSSGLASGPTTRFQYDLVGNLVTTTDALGRESSTEYDALNRAVSHILPDPSKLASDALYGKTRDANGNLRNGSNVLYGKASTTAYDEFGNVVSVTDREGRTTKFGYDVLNRKSNEYLPDPTTGVAVTSSSVTWGYDNVGNVKTLTVFDSMGSRVTKYDYDTLNRLRVTYLPDAMTGVAATPAVGATPATRLTVKVDYDDVNNKKSADRKSVV